MKGNVKANNADRLYPRYNLSHRLEGDFKIDAVILSIECSTGIQRIFGCSWVVCPTPA